MVLFQNPAGKIMESPSGKAAEEAPPPVRVLSNVSLWIPQVEP